MAVFLNKLKRYVPVFSIVAVAISIIAAVLNVAYLSSEGFADFMNGYISQPLRTVMAKLTSLLPFSLAELIVISAPVTVTAVTVVLCRRAAEGTREFVQCITGIFSVVLLAYSLFVFVFGAGYHTTSLEDKLELERTDVSAEELYDTMSVVVENLNRLADGIIYADDGSSVRPYSHAKAVELCVESYGELADEYDFIPKLSAPVKQIVLSEYMTYTHISGVYTYFTGEANLNTNYPYFVNIFTTAHEMAHQRGIAREDEANFIAFIVCINSSDPFMQYAGYLNMYDYLATPLYNASTELYSKIMRKLDTRVKLDLKCYSDFFDKYRDNIAADVSDAVNDTYLKVHGTEGSKSYGMVVDLAVAYYRSVTAENRANGRE